MEKTFAQISELFDQFSKDASLQVEKGNKAAGTRARKASLELEKLLNRSLEVIFTLVSTVWKWRHSVYHIEKKLFVSQRGGFISCDKIKYQLCEISISLLKKQLYFRISVGFRRCIVGNFSLTNSDNTFGRYSMSFQFCSNQASS